MPDTLLGRQIFRRLTEALKDNKLLGNTILMQ